MTLPDLKAFHIAIVVRDLEAAIEGYRRILGADLWRVRERSANGTRFAYGRGAGQTWEMIEVQGPGSTQFHRFLEEHGEGVQHIGFWTPDVRAAVETALKGGARLVSASTDEQGNTSVQLLPGPAVGPERLANLGMTTFLETGFGGWRIEYIGPPGEAFLRDWLKEAYEQIVTPPPWAG